LHTYAAIAYAAIAYEKIPPPTPFKKQVDAKQPRSLYRHDVMHKRTTIITILLVQKYRITCDRTVQKLVEPQVKFQKINIK
jgi:hypothetical protein